MVVCWEAEVKEGVWTKKKLNVGTGKNTYKRSENAETLQITHTDTSTNEPSNAQYAVDVSQLGGMYAEKIHLIGIEDGLSVRNAGHIGVSAANVRIDSKGKIVNSGVINAANKADFVAAKGIENTGRSRQNKAISTLFLQHISAKMAR